MTGKDVIANHVPLLVIANHEVAKQSLREAKQSPWRYNLMFLKFQKVFLSAVEFVQLEETNLESGDPVDIRRVMYTTNIIESVNSKFWKAKTGRRGSRAGLRYMVR
ncbi:hypothetical protein TH606_07530 [Thermodesulfatator autotrophicus]|uniref:Uncharacterized protein n=1 Tax=Thermodesulfatator autotrophicus TaxID=1795632 RepID=A0A177E5V1_9BACT|nr:hypothetical protein TH606_07530 [Thermodesulfatator autotrophicus]